MGLYRETKSLGDVLEQIPNTEAAALGFFVYENRSREMPFSERLVMQQYV